MRWRRIAVWVYVAVGIACGAVQRTDVGTSGPAAASSASAASAEPESAVETPDGAEPAVVIWQRSPDDSVVSRLVSLTGRRLEERDEPVVVVGNDLYAVRGRPFDVVACDCDGCDAGDCANATTHHASSITPFLVPLGRTPDGWVDNTQTYTAPSRFGERMRDAFNSGTVRTLTRKRSGSNQLVTRSENAGMRAILPTSITCTT